MERNMKEKVRDAWKHLPKSDRLSRKEKEKEKERINHEMVANKEQQNMQSRSNMEYWPCFPKTSIGQNHASLETGFGTNALFLLDKPMDPSTVRLMEIANRLYQMDWDFCGQLDMSI